MTTTRAETPAQPSSVPPAPNRSGSLVARCSAWCAAHRWRTLLAGLLVLAGAVLLLGGGIRTTDENAQLVGDSAVAVRIVDAADFGRRPVENVVIGVRAGRLDPALAQRISTELTAAYQQVPGVESVGQPVSSADGRTLLLPVTLAAADGPGGPVAPSGSPPQQAIGRMLTATAAAAARHPELAIGQVGPGSIDREVGRALDADFRRAELFSVPVSLGILLVAFGAVVAAGVPVLLGVASVLAALGLTGLASRTWTPVDENTQSLVLLIGLAVGVDYALFVMRRAREERRAGASVREAVSIAGATAGRAVVISGITVVVAMSGMLVAGGMFTSLAIGAMLVVAMAVLASATVLPALLSALGDRVEWLHLPGARRRAAKDAARPVIEGFWGRLADRVTGRPLAWSLAAAAVLLALAAPALQLRTALSGAESLPKSFQTVAAYDRLTAAFPQDGTTVDLVVKAPADRGDEVAAALRAGFAAALRTGQVVGEQPEIEVSRDGTVSVLSLAVPHDQSDPQTVVATRAVRADVLPVVARDLAGVPGAQVHVGGDAAAVVDLSGWLDQRLPWVVGFVLLLTFVVMLVSFGSPWLAAVTVALNLLSVGAAYGVITAVFQNTWAERMLGFTSIGSIASWLPLMMFVILFGLSMDYHVFVVSRVREAWNGGAGPREAVRLGVARSGGVVTSAAAVMVAVFAIFGTLSSLEMKQLGVGLATAILLDATLVRGILLPAVLALLGRRAHTGPRWIPSLHG